MMALQTRRCGSRQSLGDKCERAIDHLVDFGFVPQNAIDIELCLRIRNGPDRKHPDQAHRDKSGQTNPDTNRPDQIRRGKPVRHKDGGQARTLDRRGRK